MRLTNLIPANESRMRWSGMRWGRLQRGGSVRNFEISFCGEDLDGIFRCNVVFLLDIMICAAWEAYSSRCTYVRSCAATYNRTTTRPLTELTQQALYHSVIITDSSSNGRFKEKGAENARGRCFLDSPR